MQEEKIYYTIRVRKIISHINMYLIEFLKPTIGKVILFLLSMGGLNYWLISSTVVPDAEILVGVPLSFWPVGGFYVRVGEVPPSVEFSWLNFSADLIFWYLVSCLFVVLCRKLKDGWEVFLDKKQKIVLRTVLIAGIIIGFPAYFMLASPRNDTRNWNEDRVIDLVKASFPEVVDILRTEGAIGRTTDIAAEKTEDGWKLMFWQGWGDCQAGCINNQHWYFTVSFNGQVKKIGGYKRIYDSTKGTYEEFGKPLSDFPAASAQLKIEIPTQPAKLELSGAPAAPADQALAEITIVSETGREWKIRVDGIRDYIRYPAATNPQLEVGDTVFILFNGWLDTFQHSDKVCPAGSIKSLKPAQAEATTQPPTIRAQPKIIVGEKYLAKLFGCFEAQSCQTIGWSGWLYNPFPTIIEYECVKPGTTSPPVEPSS